jgi:hypothetical protein
MRFSDIRVGDTVEIALPFRRWVPARVIRVLKKTFDVRVRTFPSSTVRFLKRNGRTYGSSIDPFSLKNWEARKRES